jgi:hypothetical protein
MLRLQREYAWLCGRSSQTVVETIDRIRRLILGRRQTKIGNQNVCVKPLAQSSFGGDWSQQSGPDQHRPQRNLHCHQGETGNGWSAAIRLPVRRN